MGTATLRLGLASLTDTNTRRDASCVQGRRAREARRFEGGGAWAGRAAGKLHTVPQVLLPCSPLLTMSCGVTPSPRELLIFAGRAAWSFSSAVCALDLLLLLKLDARLHDQ